MRLRLHLHITNPMDFVKGDYDSCFSLDGRKWDLDGWVYAGEVEMDIPVIDSDEMNQVIVKALRRQREKLIEGSGTG